MDGQATFISCLVNSCRMPAGQPNAVTAGRHQIGTSVVRAKQDPFHVPSDAFGLRPGV